MTTTEEKQKICGQNKIVTKSSIFILVISTLLSLNNVVFSATKTIDYWLNDTISISFQKEPLSKVLKHLSEQTGITIAYDRELANKTVTGNYQNVKISDAINRLFRNNNKSIQVNKTDKIIIVKTFGAKDFIWTDFNKTPKISSKTTITELNQLNKDQYKEYKESITDSNELLPEFGMTRGELQDMQKKQYKEYKKSIANDDELLPKFGMTRGELRAMQEKQYKEYKKSIANDDELLPKFGMTRGELRAMQEKQYKEYKKSIANDDELRSEYNMTRGELRNMQEKQYKNYKKAQITPML